MKPSDLPVFETDRLFAGVWDLELAAQALEIYSDPLVCEHVPDLRCRSIEEMQSKIQWGIDRNKNWEPPMGSFPVFLKSTGRMIGTALIKNLPDGQRNLTEDIEIGWHLGSRHWGNGYATEFGRELIRIGLDDLQLKQLYAVTDITNVASQAVCRRLGMQHLGQTDKYYGSTLELFRIASD